LKAHRPSRITTKAGHPETAGGTPGELTRLSEHLAVYHGNVNVGILHDGGRALLIDCGDGQVADALSKLGVTVVEQIVFTHHHRDQACGAYPWAERGTRIGVPSAERACFDDVAGFWQDPQHRWHLYNFHPSHLMLGEALRVDAEFTDGSEFVWGPARLRVLNTPGHTDGSVSYIVDVDGTRVVFCGDVIYGPGQIWELYSLQKGFARGQCGIGDYHGFLGAQEQLLSSLARLKETMAAMLIPSHGCRINDPGQAIDALIERLDACYAKYVAISALRHYFPELFAEFKGRPGQMPIRPGKPVPDCLHHIGTTWILISRDRAAFVMDCGGRHVIDTLRQMQAAGAIRGIEGLWVTHYHDDHVDGIADFQKAFQCPCIADRSVAAVIADPLSWRLPCISPVQARVDRQTQDGESWTWHEFRLTAFHFPGQTAYHGALLVEAGALRMLFTGDSHTPAGIDDYCAQNRNWLGAGVGFDRCLTLIERLQPTHLFNCHVDQAFDFTPDECRFMRENLAERERLFGELLPWDHANYGMDNSWVRCSPYEQPSAPGQTAAIDVVFTNHSARPRRAACRAIMPPSWDAPATPWVQVDIQPRQEASVRIEFPIPRHTASGRHVIPIDVRCAGRNLPQFAEALLVMGPGVDTAVEQPTGVPLSTPLDET
jgi:glyoxylase-like metal-dependent hydrolase (beta-lactamase superfamily II)